MLGTDLPQFCLRTYYTAYIRLHLEYASICHDSISDENPVKSSKFKEEP